MTATTAAVTPNRRDHPNVQTWLEAVSGSMVTLFADLGLDVRCPDPRAIERPDLPGCHLSMETETESHIIGLVAEPDVLRHIAAVFMVLDEEDVDRALLRDAIGELTNILGGNLQDVLQTGDLIPQVGLPYYVGGPLYPSAILSEGALPLVVQGHAVYVTAVQHALPPSRVEYLRLTREVHDSHARLAAILDGAVDGVMTVDEAGLVESSNPAACRLFGEDALDGRPLAELVPGCTLDRVEARSAVERHDPAKDWRGQRGEECFPVEITSAPLRLGSRRMTTIFARDLSEKRMAEAQLRHAQKLEAIGSLAAGIAHEINTPVQFVGDNTRFVKEAFEQLLEAASFVKEISALSPGAPVGPDLVARAAKVYEAADLEFLEEEVPGAFAQTSQGLRHVTSIVKALKQLSHPDEDAHVPFDLNQTLETCVTVCRNEYKYVADLELDLASPLPSVYGRPGQVSQALLNLIVNAAHAIGDCVDKDRGRLVIRTRALAGEIEVQVEDSGSGIPENIRHRVFEPFFTTKPVGRGSGQGLAIAWATVVDGHGGALSFETSERGTTFFVRLPTGRETSRGVRVDALLAPAAPDR